MRIDHPPASFDAEVACTVRTCSSSTMRVGVLRARSVSSSPERARRATRLRKNAERAARIAL